LKKSAIFYPPFSHCRFPHSPTMSFLLLIGLLIPRLTNGGAGADGNSGAGDNAGDNVGGNAGDLGELPPIFSRSS
jgi:hypothetical protein